VTADSRLLWPTACCSEGIAPLARGKTQIRRTVLRTE